MVDAEAGTTRDPVDALVEIDGTTWRFVDTAGLRKRVNEATGAEYYSSLRTSAAIERAEVVLLLLDAAEPITDQDLRVADRVVEDGRALVVAMNKWDLVDDERRERLDREVEREFARFGWASRLNISARTGRGVQRLAPALKAALESWQTRVPTGELNATSRRWWARRRRRFAAASSRRSCSRPSPGSSRRGSCCSPPGRSRRRTAGSSNVGFGSGSGSPGTPIDLATKVREKGRRGARSR